MHLHDKLDPMNGEHGDDTFSQLMEHSDIRRCNKPPQQAHGNTRVRSTPADRRATHHPAPAGEDRAEEYQRSGVPNREMQRLKRGKFRIRKHDEEVDLHGEKRDVAYRILKEFLDDRTRQGSRYVRIICGKGIHSPDGRPVLKTDNPILAEATHQRAGLLRRTAGTGRQRRQTHLA